MTSLAEGLITAKEFGLLTLLPALLIFAIVYGLLKKTDLFGGNEWVNMLIAISVSLIFVSVVKAVKFTNKFLPVVSAGLVVFVIFLAVIKFAGVKEGDVFGIEGMKMKFGLAILVAFFFIATLYTLKHVAPAAYQPFVDLWDTVKDPSIISIIVLFGTLGLAAYAVLGGGDGGGC